MNVDVYNELMAFKEVGGDLEERIKGLSIYHVFGPLFSDKNYASDFSVMNNLIYWILDLYSTNSPKYTKKISWEVLKENVSDQYGFAKDDLRLNLLENDSLRTTIFNYLEYQGSRYSKHLFMLREQYGQMIRAALDPIRKAEEIDYKMKYDCGVYADNLLERIYIYEQKLEEEFKKLEGAVEEIEQVHEKTLFSLSVDSSHHIVN